MTNEINVSTMFVEARPVSEVISEVTFQSLKQNRSVHTTQRNVQTGFVHVFQRDDVPLSSSDMNLWYTRC